MMPVPEQRAGAGGRRRRDALDVLQAGLDAIAPAPVTRSAVSDLVGGLRGSPRGRLLILGAGKAARGMVQGALEAVAASGSPHGQIEGLVIGPPGVAPLEGPVELVAGGHPLPNEAGARAARRLLRLAAAAGEADLVLVLLSGGASALMSLPADDLSLEDLQRTSAALLASGANIHEINTVRKHLSAIAGGRLGLATHPARTACLVISDVVGDDLTAIGSGPLYGDPTAFADAVRIVQERAREDKLPAAVVESLQRGVKGEGVETPEPDSPALAHTSHTIVARNLDACRAMAACAADLGYEPLVLSHMLQGEAAELGRFHTGLAHSVLADSVPIAAPCALITGGEATVTVRGEGRGGRNQESALAAANGLAGLPVTFLSAGTDGVDGPTDAAGGVVDGASAEALAGAGIEASRALAQNDSYPALAAVDGLLLTGPTGTNVADVRLLLIGETER
ncbi:MAG TPA: DUF4147 domain-containing protein [Thermoleophilia bacterium]|nr:DUF4147 domain-containing protein [Thermoleophilia bacterium]